MNAFECDSSCEIYADKMLSDDERARYYPHDNKIGIRYDILNNQKESTKRIYLSVIHETIHAVQFYYLYKTDFPYYEQIKDAIDLLRCNTPYQKENGFYFRIDFNNTNPLAVYSRYLYMLQPVERQAHSLAKKELEIFVKEMNEIFPDDKDFQEVKDYYDLDNIMENIDEWLFVQPGSTAIEDIDNILKTMNGQYVEADLNKFICHVIEVTQEPNMIQRIREQQAINLEIRENKKREEREESEIDISDKR